MVTNDYENQQRHTHRHAQESRMALTTLEHRGENRLLAMMLKVVRRLVALPYPYLIPVDQRNQTSSPSGQPALQWLVTREGIRGRRGTIPGRVTLVGELTNVHTKQGLPSWLGED